MFALPVTKNENPVWINAEKTMLLRNKQQITAYKNHTNSKYLLNFQILACALFYIFAHLFLNSVKIRKGGH